MANLNKRNVQYFEGSSMRGLYKEINNWQVKNKKRFLSLGIERDKDRFCCIGLTNPTEVTIVCGSGPYEAHVYDKGLYVRDMSKWG